MWWFLVALGCVALGTLGMVAACRVSGRASDQMHVELDYWSAVDLPGYAVAKHVRPANLAERQEATRQRLACAACPNGRDPIDIELAQMIKRGICS